MADELNGLNFDSYVNENLAGKTDSGVELELKKIELEQKKQEIEYRKYDLALKKEDFEKLQAHRRQQIEVSQQKMMALRNFMADRARRQTQCNHRKGGVGPEALILGQGSSAMYSIIKHKLPSGNYFVICSRCGKEWHPYEKYNVEGGQIVPKPATPGWEQAINWPTDNTASVSSTFTFEKTEAPA